MTKDEILTKAWEAGLIYKKDNEWLFDSSANPAVCTVWFAEEVIFSEREACAKVCDDFAAHYWSKDDAIESVIYEECATAIRARGQA